MLIKRPFEQPKFREGFALLERHGLLFECASWHNETPQLTALAKAFPGQTIVCDHVSTPLGWGPYKSEGASAVFEEWKVRLAAWTQLLCLPSWSVDHLVLVGSARPMQLPCRSVG